MRWYLLRDRRHEGPYTKEQIAEGVKAGKIDPRDYLLPEKAVEDQSSFAYISASDVLGPEFIYDLKKSEVIKPQGASTFSVKNEQAPSTPVSKTQLISEFEEGLESTQLFNLKKEKTGADSLGASQVRLESFASQPATSSKLPWMVAGVVFVLLAVGAFFSKPLLNQASAPSVASSARSSAPTAAFRNIKQNRVPTGRVQLPSTGIRDEEPTVLGGARSEERAEPARKRRKRKAAPSESTDAVEDADAASDAESFDEEDYVEEDSSSEEDVDEGDI